MTQSAVQGFQIGDLVVAAKNYPQRNNSILSGAIGVVCDISEDMIGVDWESDVDRGHSCDGHCQHGHGWYVDADEIELYDVGQDIDEDRFLQVIGGIK